MTNAEGYRLVVAGAFVVRLVIDVAKGLRGVFVVADGKVLVTLVGLVGAVVHRVAGGNAKFVASARSSSLLISVPLTVSASLLPLPLMSAAGTFW